MFGSPWKRLHTYHLPERLKKEKKKLNLIVRGSVGSLTLIGHDLNLPSAIKR